MESQSRWRCFYPTPAWLVYASLLVTAILFFSERWRWFPFNEHKGWTVLMAVTGVGVVLLLMLLWFLSALLFRLRFQFSIRLLLVLVVVVALPCSWMAVEMKKAKEQKEAVDGLRNSGCRIWYHGDGHLFEGYVGPERISLNPSQPPWLLKLFGFEFFHGVDQVDIESDLSDDELAKSMSRFANLPEVQILKLKSLRLSNNGLAPLEIVESIKTLEIDMAEHGEHALNDEGLKHIAAMKQLETLVIMASDVTDDGVSTLHGLAKLKCLILHADNITGRSATVFASLPSLQELELSWSSMLTDEDVRDLIARKPNLKTNMLRRPSSVR